MVQRNLEQQAQDQTLAEQTPVFESHSAPLAIPPPKRLPEEWDAEEVAQWITQKGFGAWAPNFIGECEIVSLLRT